MFAWLLAHSAAAEERHYAALRRRTVGGLGGAGKTVVELGPGAGPNAAYLAPGTCWVCIEPNRHFHRYLEKAAAAHGLVLDLREAIAETLPLPDGSADAVVCTLVLCSVDDAAGVLREAQRVLKPGAPFVFVEHVAAQDGSRLRRVQRGLRKPWGLLADGCDPARDTEAAIHAAGFGRVEVERLRLPLGLIRPHIAGRAWNASEQPAGPVGTES